MSRPRLVTHACGPATALLDLVTPVFQHWAEAVGYDLVVDTTDRVGPTRSSHWNKPVVLRDHLREAPAVLWVDHDLLLREQSDPAAGMPVDACMGLCIEQTEAGIGPNTGLWYLRHDPDTFAFLDEVIAMGPIPGAVLNDQARVAERLGFTWAPQYLRPLTPRPILARTAWLDFRWNMLTVYHPEAKFLAKGYHVGGLPLDDKRVLLTHQIIEDRLPGWERLVPPAARASLARWGGPLLRRPDPLLQQAPGEVP